MAEAFQHVRELADRIGPRPATTDAEADAADYISDVFTVHGLEVERQEFVCPRTYSWAYVTYHLLTITSAVALYWQDAWSPVRWIALVVATASAIAMWLDLDTRNGLAALMPKGPSQNVIGRRLPKTRRGERVRRIVIVAHYDSAKSSLAFSPALVKNFAATFGLMKWCTFLVPVLLLVDALPFLGALDPYVWYLTLAVAAYLLVPLLINVHRELFMGATDGANDNASGVAALLGVLDAVLPLDELSTSMPTQPFRRTPEVARAAEVVPQGTLLEYSPAGPAEEPEPTGLPEDFRWAEAPGAPAHDGQGALDFDTIEFDEVKPGAAQPVARADSAAPERYERHTPGPWGDVETDFDGDGIPDVLESEMEEREREQAMFGSPARDTSPVREREAGRDAEAARGVKRFFARPKKQEHGSGAVGGWLGLDKDFDVRAEGRSIGSWDNFEDEDDDFGFKGGWAGDDPIGDEEFAANEAQRIRRRVTESVDRSLAEKEIWFVATGAEEAGTWGMRHFLDEYAGDLKGALVINLDNIGSGTLHWVTKEGMARRYTSDRRLTSAARKVSRESEILVKGREYKGLSTDATPALARGYKAMSVMAFDINGRLPDWHWRTDTTENVSSENIENAVRLVTGMLREL
jgi:hypothetical protein